MLYVKMMYSVANGGYESEEYFKIIPVGDNDSFEFRERVYIDLSPHNELVVTKAGVDRSYMVTGTCYVMNENGKTIATHHVAGTHLGWGSPSTQGSIQQSLQDGIKNAQMASGDFQRAT